MDVKKYIGSNLHDAIELAKVNLGEHIEILEVKEVRESGIIGFLSKKKVEISVIKKNYDDNNLKKEIEELRNTIYDLKNPKKNDDIEKICKKLYDLNVNNNIIEDIKTVLPNMKDDNMSNNLVEYLREKIIVTNDIEQSRIVLVGPPGVGKTTTIAKIAAKFVFEENKSVGIITIDTYRIGAVEQLKIYSDIMDVEFEAVLSQEQMNEAIDRMKDLDVILIDTTGRGCKNSMQISELGNYIKCAKTENVHLVLSITTKDKDIESIIESYQKINFKNIILTKLDETNCYGSILNIVDFAKKPISYITTGQNVPDDIRKAKTDDIIKILLGAEKIC